MEETKESTRPGLSGAPQLDELQRGQEKPVSVEGMERAGPDVYREMREVPVPDPGERPGAIRADGSPREEAPDRTAENREPA